MLDNDISTVGARPHNVTFSRESSAMENKKSYIRPEIRTENITVGVYGDYGAASGDGDDSGWSPIHILNPLFHWCCS
jgi:hypothetical protein